MSDKKQIVSDFLKEHNLVSLATITPDNKPWARFVMAKATEDLTVYIATSTQSRKVAHINANPEVHVLAGKGQGMETEFYVHIQGKAEVSTDQGLRNNLWHDEMSNYFKGPDDPNFAIVIVKPSKVEYWSMASMEPEVFEL